MAETGPDDRAQAVDEVERQLAGLVRRLRARWRALSHQVHPEVQPLGYLLLALLVSRGPTPSSRLLAELGTDKSTLSRQVAHLERLGLIERRIDDSDRRVHLLTVPSATAERVTRVQELSLTDLRGELDAWPLADIAALGLLLGRLAGALVVAEPTPAPAD